MHTMSGGSIDYVLKRSEGWDQLNDYRTPSNYRILQYLSMQPELIEKIEILMGKEYLWRDEKTLKEIESERSYFL